MLKIFPVRLRPMLGRACWDWEQLEEIRIRAGQPIIFSYGDREKFFYMESPYLSEVGGRPGGAVVPCEREKDAGWGEPYRIGTAEVKEMLNYMCSFSLYAYAEDLQRGFLTLPGGNRVGVCGEMADAGGGVRAMEYPGFFNIRIAHEKRDCARPYLPYIRQGDSIYHTLILSPPGVGKTTFLRDCIRLLGQGASGVKSIGLVDERYEIAASVRGIPQNDVGMRCDVLSGCEKRQGAEIMLRTMGPAVIAVDEVGGREDEEMLQKMIYSGVRVIATVHAGDVEELTKRQRQSYLTQDMFQRYVVLKREAGGRRSAVIYDEQRRRLC